MNNNELKVSHKDNSNESFMNLPATITNKTIFSENEYTKIGLLENPYMTWAEERVTFKKIAIDTISTNKKNENDVTLLTDQYNLSFKIFLDINSYSDTLDVLTAAVFDPYESFYYLPINTKTNCFINIYFDLIEIERLRLMEEIENGIKTKEAIDEHYKNCMDRIDMINQSYFKDVERGTNQLQMEIWNGYVTKKLGINNIALFDPYNNKVAE